MNFYLVLNIIKKHSKPDMRQIQKRNEVVESQNGRLSTWPIVPYSKGSESALYKTS